MLFSPPGPGNILPPDFGGVHPRPPAGARFDPFGPIPNRRNRGDPNPDHFAPPGAGRFDDMFM